MYQQPLHQHYNAGVLSIAGITYKGSYHTTPTILLVIIDVTYNNTKNILPNGNTKRYSEEYLKVVPKGNLARYLKEDTKRYTENTFNVITKTNNQYFLISSCILSTKLLCVTTRNLLLKLLHNNNNMTLGIPLGPTPHARNMKKAQLSIDTVIEEQPTLRSGASL